PAVLRVPATAIRLLMGESSVLVLGGAPAQPKTQEPGGFKLPWYLPV
ncbi:TIGR01777 family oxidoreductase, partial [Enterobacter hormaechei]